MPSGTLAAASTSCARLDESLPPLGGSRNGVEVLMAYRPDGGGGGSSARTSLTTMARNATIPSAAKSAAGLLILSKTYSTQKPYRGLSMARFWAPRPIDNYQARSLTICLSVPAESKRPARRGVLSTLARASQWT